MSSPKKLLCVEISETPTDRNVSEGERVAVRFLHYNQPVKCALCGASRTKLKTMLCAFLAIDTESGKPGGRGDGVGEAYSPKKEGTKFPPLTAVCEDHQLSPDWQS